MTRSGLLILLLAFCANASALPCGPSYAGVAPGHSAPLLKPRHLESETALREAVRHGTAEARRVAVVVPVYSELANGNIFRFLEDFSRQTAAPNQFEIQFVVNNTPQVAADREPVFLENQSTLAILRYLEGGPRPALLDELPAWQKQAVEEAKSKGLRCHVLDLSTEGTERNMGAIRGRGFEAVWGRLPKDGDVLVATMDADTRVPANYLENAQMAFAFSPIEALFLPMQFQPEPGASRELLRSTLRERANYSGHAFDEALAGKVHAPGPQIIASAKAIHAAGGVPAERTGENDTLAANLAQTGRFAYAKDITVFTADRARAGSFVGALRLHELSGPEKNTPPENQALRLAVKYLDDTAYEIRRGKVPKAQVLKALERAGAGPKALEPFASLTELGAAELNQIRKSLEKEPAKYFPKELLEGNAPFVGFAKAKLSAADFAPFERELEGRRQVHDRGVEDLKRVVKERVGALKAGRPPPDRYTDPSVEPFLGANPWIDSAIQEHLAGGGDAAGFVTKLSKEFPDWFLNFDETPRKKEVEAIEAFTSLIREARAHPEALPSLQAFLK